MTDNTKVYLNDASDHISWFDSVAGKKGRVDNPDTVRPHLNTTISPVIGGSTNNPLPHETTVQIDNKTIKDSYKNVEYDHSDLIKNLNAQEFIRFIMSNQNQPNDTLELYRMSIYNDAVKLGFPKPYSPTLPISEVELFLNTKRRMEEKKEVEKEEMSGHSTPLTEEEKKEVFETPSPIKFELATPSTTSSSPVIDLSELTSELTPVSQVIKEIKKHVKHIRHKEVETPIPEEKSKNDPMITDLWGKIDTLVNQAGHNLKEDLTSLSLKQLYELAHIKSGTKADLSQKIANQFIRDQSRVLKGEFADEDTIPASVLRKATTKIYSKYIQNLPHAKAKKLKSELGTYNEELGYGLRSSARSSAPKREDRKEWTKLGKYQISLYYLKQRNQLNIKSASGTRIPGYRITTISIPMKNAILEVLRKGSTKNIDTELNKDEKMILKRLFEKAKVDKQNEIDRVFPTDKPMFDKEQANLLGETSIKKLFRQFSLTVSEIYAGNDSPALKEQALLLAKKLFEVGEFDIDTYRTVKKQILRMSNI